MAAARPSITQASGVVPRRGRFSFRSFAAGREEGAAGTRYKPRYGRLEQDRVGLEGLEREEKRDLSDFESMGADSWPWKNPWRESPFAGIPNDGGT